MDNHDEKSELSPTEKRLKKSIARGAVGIRTKKHPLKTPVKIRPTFLNKNLGYLRSMRLLLSQS